MYITQTVTKIQFIELVCASRWLLLFRKVFENSFQVFLVDHMIFLSNVSVLSYDYCQATANCFKMFNVVLDIRKRKLGYIDEVMKFFSIYQCVNL